MRETLRSQLCFSRTFSKLQANLQCRGNFKGPYSSGGPKIHICVHSLYLSLQVARMLRCIWKKIQICGEKK